MTVPVELPPRAGKPRQIGRTQILDNGHGTAWLDDQLEVAGAYVDLAKLGWGTSIVTPNLQAKLEVYRRHDVEVCLGGTLMELAYLQGRMAEYADWAESIGVSSVEVSDGTVVMSSDDKLRWISELAKRFTVYSEVGSKDAAAIVSPVRWVRAIEAELDAGVAYVILEGRESGTAGMYRQSGEIRMGLIDEIVESGVPIERLIFEAPNKAQQVWLLMYAGSDINLGNIHVDDVISVETLRLGLRADTLLHIHDADATS